MGDGLTGNRSVTDLTLDGCSLAAINVKEGNMNGLAGFLNCVAHDAVLRSISLRNNALTVYRYTSSVFCLPPFCF